MFTCPVCNKEFEIDYSDEEKHYSNRNLFCSDECFENKRNEIINLIRYLLDTLNLEQRIVLIKLLEKMQSNPIWESVMTQQIIQDHFHGSEGMLSWGDW